MPFKARSLLPYFYLSLPFFGFSVFAVGQRGIRIDWLFSIFFIGIMIVNKFTGKVKKINVDFVTISLLSLLVCVSFSILSPILDGNIRYITDFVTTYMQFVVGAMLFLFAYQLTLDNRDIERLLKCIIVISSLVSAFGILQLIFSYFGFELKLTFTNPGRALQHSGYEEVTGLVRRSTGTFSEPRQFGAYLLTGMAIAAVSWKKKIALFRRRYLQTLLFWLILFGILSSLSTSSILNMANFLVFFSFFELIVRKGILRRSVLRWFFGICFIFFFFTSFIFVSPIGEIIAGRVKMPDLGGLYESFSDVPEKAHRWDAYVRGQRLALSVFFQNPVVGVGLNNFHAHIEAEYPGLIGPKGCHGPLRYLAQTGLVGVFGFGIFVVSLINKLRKKWKYSVFKEEKAMADLGLILIVVSFIASFGSLFTLTSTFFWANMTLIGLILRTKLISAGKIPLLKEAANTV